MPGKCSQRTDGNITPCSGGSPTLEHMSYAGLQLRMLQYLHTSTWLMYQCRFGDGSQPRRQELARRSMRIQSTRAAADMDGTDEIFRMPAHLAYIRWIHCTVYCRSGVKASLDILTQPDICRKYRCKRPPPSVVRIRNPQATTQQSRPCSYKHSSPLDWPCSSSAAVFTRPVARCSNEVTARPVSSLFAGPDARKSCFLQFRSL